jgi:hypothetical protein
MTGQISGSKTAPIPPAPALWAHTTLSSEECYNIMVLSWKHKHDRADKWVQNSSQIDRSDASMVVQLLESPPSNILKNCRTSKAEYHSMISTWDAIASCNKH